MPFHFCVFKEAQFIGGTEQEIVGTVPEIVTLKIQNPKNEFLDILRFFCDASFSSTNWEDKEAGDEGECVRTLILFETRTVRSERS